MHVVAVVAIILADPVEPIKIPLNCLNEILAGDDSVWNLPNFSAGVCVDINV